MSAQNRRNDGGPWASIRRLPFLVEEQNPHELSRPRPQRHHPGVRISASNIPATAFHTLEEHRFFSLVLSEHMGIVIVRSLVCLIKKQAQRVCTVYGKQHSQEVETAVEA